MLTASATTEPQYVWLRLGGQLVRWEARGGLKPGVVTYGFVQSRMAFGSAHNCKAMDPLDGIAASMNKPLSIVEQEIVKGIKQWEMATPLRFEQAKDWTKAQILIGARPKSSGSGFADVFPSHARGPIAGIQRSLICFDAGHRWKIGFDGNMTSYDIRYVAMHEAGHAIGLDHPGSSGEVMSYKYQETFRSLQPGDVRGAKSLYDADGASTLAQTR
ncbi:matrixin family metalloprotease [Pseudorhodoplanes sp.]|uniref:matrixin family metalloprotease n=1 Tax=Pseudorhodoplanes sp. TaxID=1934341 RepID=UPI003D1050FA